MSLTPKQIMMLPLINARQGGRTVRVPNELHINNGIGATYYLAMKDPTSRKPIYYAPEVWAGMSEAQRKAAMDFTAAPDLESATRAERLLGDIDNAAPLVKEAALDRLAAMLAGRKAEKAEKGGAAR